MHRFTDAVRRQRNSGGRSQCLLAERENHDEDDEDGAVDSDNDDDVNDDDDVGDLRMWIRCLALDTMCDARYGATTTNNRSGNNSINNKSSVESCGPGQHSRKKMRQAVAYHAAAPGPPKDSFTRVLEQLPRGHGDHPLPKDRFTRGHSAWVAPAKPRKEASGV